MKAAVPRNRRLRTESWLFAIIAAEIIALNILWAPITLDFGHFAFCDNGANLTLQYLISHGYRPTIDFAYPYGLLPVLLGRIWFAVVGTSPVALQILILLCELGMGFAFARIAAALRLNGISITIILITLWFSIHPNYPSITHSSEALLLTLALSEQASRERTRALMFATAAVFAKPSMGYVYLAWMVVLWFRRTPRSERRECFLSEVFTPVAVTGAVCGAALSAIYGLRVLIRTLFPIEGAGVYKALNDGFFSGSGRLFWDPSHNSVLSYLFGPAGLWIFATIFLAYAAFGSARRIWLEPDSNNTPERIRDEIILTCFLLHAAFVCVFFGNQASWFYYSYFLVIGVAVAAGLGTVGRRTGFAVCCLGALSLFGATLAILRDWKTQRPRAVTARLWSPHAEAAEWSRVLRVTNGTHATILDTKGAAELIFPQFQPPTSLYLDRGLMRQSEIDRKVRQLADSDLVVVPLGPATCGGIPRAPEIQDEMRSFESIFSGQYFDVYRHTTPGAKP